MTTGAQAGPNTTVFVNSRARVSATSAFNIVTRVPVKG